MFWSAPTVGTTENVAVNYSRVLRMIMWVGPSVATTEQVTVSYSKVLRVIVLVGPRCSNDRIRHRKIH